jgi:phage shock protein A
MKHLKIIMKKLWTWVCQKKKPKYGLGTNSTIKILEQNVSELQQQLANANKRIAKLVAENKNKQEALLDVVRILKKGLK